MAVVFFNNWKHLGAKEFIMIEISSVRNNDNQIVITFALLGLGVVIVKNI